MGWKTPRVEIRPGPLYRSCCNAINANRSRRATIWGASQPAGVRLGVGVGPSFELRPRSPRVPTRIVLQSALSCSGATNYHHVWLGLIEHQRHTRLDVTRQYSHNQQPDKRKEQNLSNLRKSLAVLGIAALSLPVGAQVKVGLVTSFSGSFSHLGAATHDAAKIVVKEANAKLPRDRQIEIVVEDDACDPKQGSAVAQKLVDSKVRLVIGHSCTSGAAARIYAEAGAVFIATGGGSGVVLTKASPTAFRMQAGTAMIRSVAGAAKIGDLQQGGFSLGDCDLIAPGAFRLSTADKTILGRPREPDSPIVCPVSPVARAKQPQGLRDYASSKKLGGVDPWTSQTYAAMQMLTVAMQGSNDQSPAKVAEYLRKTPIKTDFGMLQFSPSGMLNQQSISVFLPKSSDLQKLERSLPASVSASASDDPANDPSHPKSGCTRKSCTTEESCDTDSNGNKTNCKRVTNCEYTC